MSNVFLALVLFVTPAFAQIGITFGTPEPVCSYGYYDYAPFACAPYGYYGPEFFVGGRYHPRQAWGQRDRGGRGGDSGNRQKPNAGHQSNGHGGSGRPGGGHQGGKR